MKSLNQYITENLTSKQANILGNIFDVLFKSSKVNQETIKIMLSNLDKDVIYNISKYFNENNDSDYLSYCPNDDEFLNYDENKEKIVNQIAEYIHKYKL